MEIECIVKLKKIRKSQRLPGSHQIGCTLLILFASLRFDVNAMAEKVHHIKGVKLAIVLNIPRTDQICLMDVIKA